MTPSVRCNTVVFRTILGIALLATNTTNLFAQIQHGNNRPIETGVEGFQTLKATDISFAEMPTFNLDSILFTDDLPGNRFGGLKFAHTFFTQLSPQNSGMSYTTNGIRIWKVGIRSNGAHSLNVLFDQFDLPDSARLFLYNTDRSVVYGPFTNQNKTGNGEFMVAPVVGDELIVEYQEPTSAGFRGRIRISEVKHDYRGLLTKSSPRFNSINLPCIPDITCEQKFDTLKQSVCLLIINGDTYCTGTFLNNTAQDGKPYVLTAAHCLENNWGHGNRIVAFQNYESPNCQPRIRGSEEFSLSGSICRALNTELDFALIEFLEKPPLDYRVFLSGWSLNTTVDANSPFTCLQHPNGDTKKYSEVDVPPVFSDGNPSNLTPNEHWYIQQWNIGHTWSGSSGSGLFDASNRMIGILNSGGSGGLFGCSPYTQGDYFSRFDLCWNFDTDSSKNLKYWLDPRSLTDFNTPNFTQNGFLPHSENAAKRISNILPDDSISRLPVPSGFGSMFGHNSFATKRFSEHFIVSDSSLLLGTYIMVAKGRNNSDKPVFVEVFEDNHGVPGRLLTRELLNPTVTEYLNGELHDKNKAYFSNRENYHRFSSPVVVGKRFFVGFDITYPVRAISDSFQVYGAIRNSPINTAYYQKERAWYPLSMHAFNPMNTSIWLDPILIKDTTHVEIGIDSISSTQLPIVLWSRIYSTLEISFPKAWQGATKLELLDQTGRIIFSQTVFPPYSSTPIGILVPKVYLVRLENGLNRTVQKIAAGYD